ncbi:MAG: phage holin family protein [Chromatiales bacterium]|nr:phage holin family protein [Chromatiales bacterium]
MENNTPSAGGPISKLLQSLRNVLASLIDVGQTRLELLTLELQVEVRRAAGLLAIGFFTIFFAGMGCLLAGLSLIFAFWDSQRILVSVLVTAFFFLMASLGAWKLSSQLRRKPPMLADTLGELKKDSDGLRGGMRNGS